MARFGAKLKHAWNVFTSQDEQRRLRTYTGD